jgi:Na+(H+)/acetate symporter ActP
MGPAFWVKAMGNPEPILPTDYPGLVAIPATFLVAWIASTVTRGSQQSITQEAVKL